MVLLVVSGFNLGNFFVKEDTDMVVNSHKVLQEEIEN